MSKIKLIVGLGNPGTQYQYNRHNVGFLTLDRIYERSGLISKPWTKKFKGEFAKVTLEGLQVLLLKPMTFMNLSGESVRPLMDFFNIHINEILIVHDELDLAFNRIAFKKGGGLAGHNGLKSIKAHLGSDDFLRLRLGIDRPKGSISVSQYVLSNYESPEQLSHYLDDVSEALVYFLNKGLQESSQKYHNKDLAIF